MDSHVFNFDYSKKKEFYFLLAGDLHVGDRLFSKKRFKCDFDEAVKMNARIYINGDLMRLITPKDMRYTKDEDRTHVFPHVIDDNIYEVSELLKPYANYIDLIGAGNHETAIIKYNSSDPLIYVLNNLNQARDVKKYGLIQYGGYTGFITQVFRHGKNNRTRTYEIYYNHGQGGNAEVTGGMISLNRRKTEYMVNLIWQGHIHRRQMDDAAFVRLDSKHKPVIVDRRAIITGCYVKRFENTDSKNGYRLNYGEQRMRRLQAPGGIFMWHNLSGEEIETRFIY